DRSAQAAGAGVGSAGDGGGLRGGRRREDQDTDERSHGRNLTTTGLVAAPPEENTAQNVSSGRNGVMAGGRGSERLPMPFWSRVPRHNSGTASSRLVKKSNAIGTCAPPGASVIG